MTPDEKTRAAEVGDEAMVAEFYGAIANSYTFDAQTAECETTDALLDKAKALDDAIHSSRTALLARLASLRSAAEAGSEAVAALRSWGEASYLSTEHNTRAEDAAFRNVRALADSLAQQARLTPESPDAR